MTNFLNKQILQKDHCWTKELISLYIIRKNDGICLFSHHFKLGQISHIEDQLVGMGFIGIINMMLEVVDSQSHPRLIDLGGKKVFIKEERNILAILITTRYVKILEAKLEEFTNYFSKIFELQQQINQEECLVCAEDYALTSELVPLIFTKQAKKPLDMVPLIFKTIQKRTYKSSESDTKLSKILQFPVSIIKK